MLSNGNKKGIKFKMKKLLIHVFLILAFIFIYLLQSIFFTNFTIAGVKPNLFVILILFIGLYTGRSIATIYGIFYGILIDLWIGKTIGITSVCLALVGIIAGIFDKNFSKDNRLIIVFVGALSTIIYEIAVYTLQIIVFEMNVEILAFIKILLLETIYNILIIIILYPLIRNFGYEVESEIKGDKILTRYF